MEASWKPKRVHKINLSAATEKPCHLLTSLSLRVTLALIKPRVSCLVAGVSSFIDPQFDRETKRGHHRNSSAASGSSRGAPTTEPLLPSPAKFIGAKSEKEKKDKDTSSKTKRGNPPS